MRQNPSWISDFNWCIDNDWQVYIIPGTYKDHRIGVRKGGISSHGIDYRRDIYGAEYYSSEIVGSKTYKTQKDAMEGLKNVYSQLRKKYEVKTI
jgi:hypothetical protein